uniref:OCIA domain containing 2 n=2 Tax=Cyprinodon variegatus TaxID=28743 RepID=A0A3Q2CFE3_CYPVA
MKTEEATAAAPDSAPTKQGWKCPLSDAHVHREDVRKVWKECQEESFWYRALPLSLGSMTVTGGLIYSGVWKSSARFGPFPKLAVAGILGFAVGKVSYAGTCRRKFQEIGIQDGPGSWSRKGPSGPGSRNRHCHHECEECKKKTQSVPAEQA